MTTLIAIYGAVLSTLVAIIHFRNFWISERYIYLSARRYLGPDSERLEFDISNRAKDPTEVQEVSVWNYGNGGEVGFHMVWAVDRTVFKGQFKEGDNVEIDLPLRLGPGETIRCVYETEDANRDAISYSYPDIFPDEKFSNLFAVVIEHSRSNNGKQFLFELDLKFLCEKYSCWKSSVPFYKRWKYWPVNQHY